MITVKDLSFSYNTKQVLFNINFQFEKGNIYCLVGENGAGKTTLLEIILKLKQIQKGQIIFDKTETLSNSILEKTGVVFQENTLRPRLKVKEEIDAYKDLYNVEKIWVDYIINTFKLDALLNKIGNSLSGGERRRVLMALSFINKPEYIILDEPFTGIDTKLRDELRIFLDDYVRDNNATIIFSEHNILECQKYNYNFIFMYAGSFLLTGKRKDIKSTLLAIDYEYTDLQELYLDIWERKELVEKLIKK